MVEIYEISISNGEVKLTDTKTHHRPSIRNLNNRIVVNSLSQSEESIGLSIYNQSGELIYSFEQKHSGDFVKAFSLAELKEGSYRVLVSTAYFTKELQVEL